MAAPSFRRSEAAAASLPFATTHVNIARLLLPAVRWNKEAGFEQHRATVEEGLELGVGGFILFNGEADSVREFTAELQRRSRHPLLIASDLERGAGQQFRGATPLPPAAALGYLDEPETTRRAGELTAREARALGVNWIYAPVADVDLEPRNPIIGTRAFGRTAETVATHVAAWTAGCSAGQALCCAKHFPGHGRTVGDSHIEKPVVEAPRELLEVDLLPFRAAVRAGVDSMMTAHVAYPALAPSRLPATLAPRILGDLLRDQLGFGGLVVTDALVMEGFIEDMDEAAAAVEALRAGCDVLLYPQDTRAVVAAVSDAVEAGRLPRERVENALQRLARAAARVAGPPTGEWGAEADRRWALDTALRTVHAVRGEPRLPAGPLCLHVVDDDLGGPWPPYSREALPVGLRAAGRSLGDGGTAVIALFSDIRAWKGTPGISPDARARMRAHLAATPDATVLLFGPPRLADDIPEARHVLAAWGGEALMQEAAVAWLTGARGGLPTAAAGLDR